VDICHDGFIHHSRGQGNADRVGSVAHHLRKRRNRRTSGLGDQSGEQEQDARRIRLLFLLPATGHETSIALRPGIDLDQHVCSNRGESVQVLAVADALRAKLHRLSLFEI